MRPADDELLTTTQVAALLHCSRQHVATLCDSGALPSTRAGTHRRIRRSDVERFVRPPLRREDERSLWINYALAAKLIRDPGNVIERATKRLQQLRRIHGDGSVNHWFDRWQVALSEGPTAVLAIMTERSDAGQAMRSSSPMTGIGLLTPEERSQVLTSFQTYWRSSHHRKSA
jgi:excisionase family DNA binding protein